MSYTPAQERHNKNNRALIKDMTQPQKHITKKTFTGVINLDAFIAQCPDTPTRSPRSLFTSAPGSPLTFKSLDEDVLCGYKKIDNPYAQAARDEESLGTDHHVVEPSEMELAAEHAVSSQVLMLETSVATLHDNERKRDDQMQELAGFIHTAEEVFTKISLSMTALATRLTEVTEKMDTFQAKVDALEERRRRDRRAQEDLYGMFHGIINDQLADFEGRHIAPIEKRMASAAMSFLSA